MSSGEEDINDNEGQSIGQELKKRRIQRACDICRRKKIRCDGGQMPQNRCSNCIAYSFECTYVEAAKKRGPPKGYVESLENRLENMEKLLQRLCPDADFTQELGVKLDRDSWKADNKRSPQEATKGLSRHASPSNRLATSATPANAVVPAPVDPDELVPSDDELGHTTLTEGLKRLAVEPLDRRFHGKSSGVMLVQAAMNLKKVVMGADQPDHLLVPPTRRMDFWLPRPWENLTEETTVRFRYPPDDLLPKLVDNYFIYMNPFLPILHRPSFERAIASRHHYADVGFGSVVMLVCSIGSRWSDDMRVRGDGLWRHSAGWKYFDQVEAHRRSFLGPPRLYDLQIYALSAIFLQSSSSPQSSWTLTGIGIRMAQDVGAHRRKVYNVAVSIESELWKRAFWVLVALDRFSSAALGRPCAIQDEDFDLELPLEVDDDYWEHPDPAQAFKQPPGMPSSISFFNCFLKLTQILAFALRTIYSINKSKVLLGFVGPQWEQHIVAELDSALNKWIDTVPDHLRWDPHRENFLFFNQSATLYAFYYHIQILIHRPFIPSRSKPSPLTFPSLAICTNAARSCSHVADIQRRRGGLPIAQIQIAVFTSGIVLLLNIWGAKKSGGAIEPASQMADVIKCMDVLRNIEERWMSAGRLWDILNELATIGDLPPTIGSGNKRERGSDSPISSAPSPADSYNQSASPAISDARRPIAGRRSLGSTPTLSVSQPPSIASSSPAPHVNNLPRGSEPLQTPDIAGGGMQLINEHNGIHGIANPSSTSSSSWMPSFSDGINQAPLPSGSQMPNLNIFDLFQSDPSMFNMLDSTFSQDAQQVQHQQSQGQKPQDSWQVPDPSITPLEGAIGDALQMWSDTPLGFGLDDWGAYLGGVNNVAGASHQQQQRQTSGPTQ